MISTIKETAEHFDAVRKLTIEAFSSSAFGHNGEAELIESVRQQCNDALSLVAIDREEVVGHILFSPATIRCKNKTHHGMGLGPIAVLPTHQRQGIGSMLVSHGMKQLALLEVEFTVVAGHPDFYPRFDFVPAANLAIVHGFEGMPQDILFIHTKESRPDFGEGRVYYHTAFGAQHVGAE